MKTKFPGKCSACGLKFPKDTKIKFDTDKRTAEHVECPEQSYDGTEQANIFNQWIERAEKEAQPTGGPDSFFCGDTEYSIRYLDGIIPVYEAYEDEMWADTSPHLSQPDEDMED